ncbi:hypothetical protein EJP82_02345 [Paenibacillus anaericanus]|uniref:Uncharacterized protein n=1 Tax=Paenibacillus anaericanus TaxID=170367 RepID=A0A3S1BRI8_9BACL|nr:hypothetical protein [Paenibacillus anaericanus]RUT48003.1 hypothetical protein EJP82_02345 [Paenibacillus anaericanus]
MILRNFLYLDTSVLNDYLSTIEGFIEEGPIDQTETEKSNKSGKANIKFAEGNLQAETSTETRQKIARTDASKFNNLYDYLAKENLNQFLDAFDDEIWRQIRRGEIIEVPSSITISKVFKMTQDLQSMSPMIDIMQAFGQEPFKDKQESNMFAGISSLGEHATKQNIPIIFESESTRGYSFYTRLQRQYLKTDISNLEGEADILGKVQKIIPKGKQEEVFSIVPAFDSFLSREQKRKMLSDKKGKNLSDFIKGPAIVVTPIAIYR